MFYLETSSRGKRRGTEKRRESAQHTSAHRIPYLRTYSAIPTYFHTHVLRTPAPSYSILISHTRMVRIVSCIVRVASCIVRVASCIIPDIVSCIVSAIAYSHGSYSFSYVSCLSRTSRFRAVFIESRLGSNGLKRVMSERSEQGD